MIKQNYQKSEEYLAAALKVIPLGTQTFSKSKTQYPHGVSPFFIEKGKGSKVWDVDGNEYIDFVNSLAAVTLGYCDPDVDEAVRAQMEKGVLFSLPHSIEIEVAKKIIEMVPCAEKVRFGKNGSDGTAGAVRVSRAFTKRDHVAVCGYHGWQDWYIGSTARNLGVPDAVRDLTHAFQYNDIDSLFKIFKQFPNQMAAVMLEPMNVAEPKDQFLQKVQELSRKHGAVLVFDEVVTGFRYANGGAQEYFGVTPDMAVFGKGLANGFPLSAVTGREDLMDLFEEVFFSFTFGGETLSLAAALATLTKLQQKPVLETIRKQGEKILQGVSKLIGDLSLQDFLSVSGHPSWSFLNFKDANGYSLWDIKTLFLQECFARGILTLSTHNISYAHSDQDIATLLEVYEEIFIIVKSAVSEKKLAQSLKCKPLAPLFKIR